MKNKNNPTKRGNIVVRYLKQVKDELYQVIWPSKEETIRMTTLVIIVSVLVSIYLGSLDLLFSQMMGLIIN